MENHKTSTSPECSPTPKNTQTWATPDWPPFAPQPRILAGLDRSLDLVDPYLVSVFQDLIEGRRPWPLFLSGKVGTGKTMAALALCDFFRRSAYFTVDDLCDVVMGENGNAKYFLWHTIGDDKLIVIDELAAREKIGDLHYSTLKKALDMREASQGKRAIYISNLSPAEIAKVYDDRICSRLLCGTRFALTGPDRRLTNRDQSFGH